MKITKRQLKRIIKEELHRTVVLEGIMDRIKSAFGKGKKKGGEGGGAKAAASEMVKGIEKAYQKWEKEGDERSKKQLLQLQKAYEQLEDKFMDDGSWNEVSDVMERGNEFFKQFVEKVKYRSGPKRKEGERLTDPFSNQDKAEYAKEKGRKDRQAAEKYSTKEKDRTRSKWS